MLILENIYAYLDTMWRKLYALLILIGVIAFGVLLYLYFFVFYTSTLTVEANVSSYQVELFSKSTTQKTLHKCPEQICIISDVSPFDYNITILKEGYIQQVIPASIKPRSREKILTSLEKKTELVSTTLTQIEETPQEKIQRIRMENTYYASFVINSDTQIFFSQDESVINLSLRQNDEIYRISQFPLIPSDEIVVDTIAASNNIFIKLAESYYIFDIQKRSITQLPFELDILYLKPGSNPGEYLVVSEKGVFRYDIYTNTSEFEYQFVDFLYAGSSIIGVILDSEEQKKKNFNLTEPGNLIIKYSQRDKSRKVIYATKDSIERLEWIEENIIVTTSEGVFELQNY